MEYININLKYEGDLKSFRMCNNEDGNEDKQLCGSDG